MLSAITKPTELIVDIQLEQRKNPDGTIQIVIVPNFVKHTCNFQRR